VVSTSLAVLATVALLEPSQSATKSARAFVLGVSDKNYNIIGRAPVMCVQRNDLLPPETGFQWCVLHGGDLRVRRFFVSYSGKRVVWYFGHQPTGFFGCKFNLHSSHDSWRGARTFARRSTV